MELTDNLEPLAKDLFWVKAPGNGKFPFCNGFLLTGDEIVLIDAGLGSETILELDKQYKIDTLVISHSHPDHIMSWHCLTDRRILMPKETPEVVSDLDKLGFRFTGTKEKAKSWKARVADGLGLRPMRLPDARYSSGETVGNDKVKLEAIHAPGHLNDHYCFFHEESKTLLSTDIDFDSFGPWYGNPECSIELFKQSIEKVRAYPYEVVCSSHKPPMNRAEGEVAFETYIGLFDDQKERVLQLCDTPKTLEELIACYPFYRDKMKDKKVQAIFEEMLIFKNLELLLKNELIIQNNNKYIKVDT